MAFCTNCGNLEADGIKFCTSCGALMDDFSSAQTVQPEQPASQPEPPVSQPVQPASQPVQPIQQQPAPQQVQQPPQYAIPPTQATQTVYKEVPISTGGYVGIIFLLSLPLINLLFLIIWACGGCNKVNKRNFARAILIWVLIGIILSGLLFLTATFIYDEEINALKDWLLQQGGLHSTT